jgi:hypothetical protein
MSEPKQPRCPITPAAPAPTPTRRDALMRALAANPRFKIVKPSGKGFIIGGREVVPQN